MPLHPHQYLRSANWVYIFRRRTVQNQVILLEMFDDQLAATTVYHPVRELAGNSSVVCICALHKVGWIEQSIILVVIARCLQ